VRHLSGVTRVVLGLDKTQPSYKAYGAHGLGAKPLPHAPHIVVEDRVLFLASPSTCHPWRLSGNWLYVT
jgi:hypothetical protein